ncbi:DUF1294 domain-containing protein [Xanthomonas hortorum pv. pelargonii]|uniref:DUF1294 domain-containing protein n=1 Tax=Xanthomonas hortorum pv. pelargonii TaxID=453602 RepID=A0A6V7CZC8_9XANT|nr:DUF1294 domain-containing protein [Xanthomonas hortorum]MCE4353398.1 DUF1294 domain-containing protein [Xanthomonas hortorum pv. pelargonii]UUE97894.1 DUF1294 domain-containing protein [Xanthomonas hortorum pv. pelargonii]UUF02060.1 DUF1294 domain-containing protein [Xanthomonas hortorum pv. pelargonii]WCI06611.1 DUF1294 domain-containing protein [Xanthomonas hortorum pv. pelargonii]WOB23758.1 DUF1294 domain-containing protein [Xanthomonas hortorum pv. pelargonii]
MQRRRDLPQRGGLPRKTLAMLFLIGMAAMVATGRLPALLALWYAVASVLAMILYRRDKTAAQRGRRRTPEATLHIIALLGGWPGALLAQALFRHKSSKTAFQLRFWIIVVVNVAMLFLALRQPALMAALHALLN